MKIYRIFTIKMSPFYEGLAKILLDLAKEYEVFKYTHKEFI